MLLLTLEDERSDGCQACGGCDAEPAAGGCGEPAAAGGCGTEAAPDGCATARPRVPVLACRDALVAGGARVRLRSAHSDADIDRVLAEVGPARLVVAASCDGQVRAVVRRMVRRAAPPPSQRPADLPTDRTVPDLPPIAILPLDADQPGPRALPDLPARLGLPRAADRVAGLVLAGRERRLDLLRTDAGSVTLHGALLGGTDAAGRAAPFAARVEVDDAVLTDGSDPVLAVTVANADGYRSVDGLPMLATVEPADGILDVAIAVPVIQRGMLRRRQVRFEVRRARGRAVAVEPRTDLPFLDDGVAGTLTRKRTWWIERGAWAVYA